MAHVTHHVYHVTSLGETAGTVGEMVFISHTCWSRLPCIMYLPLQLALWASVGCIAFATTADILRLPRLEVHDAVEASCRNRSRRSLLGLEGYRLAVPAGAIVSIAPRFGWLLYQGIQDEEELDFVLESEFLYRFPHEEEDEHEEEEEHHEEAEEEHHDRETEEEQHPHGYLVLRRSKRMISDKVVLYKAIQNALSVLGVDGKACLLRAICEVSATPLLYDGVIGELLNLILVPRHLNGHHGLLETFIQAEQHGQKQRACSDIYSGCRLSMFQQVFPGNVKYV